MKKVELLAPAGDLEKLKIAVEYGADAVYFGAEAYSLRAAAKNLTNEDIREGVTYAHDRGKKAYMTLNILAHNSDIDKLGDYIKSVAHIGIDAFIVSDPGVISLIRELLPNQTIHLSTQASTANYKSAAFWHEQGVKRIVLARELSISEISNVREKTPRSLEIETFVHGAMCISYSGRCLLSNILAHRDANRGECAHPCRWNYVLMEEQRPGEYMPVFEDGRGTYIMNSKDLCMIGHIPKLIEAGVDSFKIEGRMKSVFYVATVVGAYRKAIDMYFENREFYRFSQEWMRELETVSNRNFTTGFYLGMPDQEDQNYESTVSDNREYVFAGVVKSYDEDTGIATIEQRNKMEIGDTIEIFGPFTDYFSQKLESMTDEYGNPIESAPHPQQLIKVKVKNPVRGNFILRKVK